jgi:multiple sugar transport system permease protein
MVTQPLARFTHFFVRCRNRWTSLLWEMVAFSLIVLVIVLAILPLVWMVSSSLKYQVDIFAKPPVFFFTPTFQEYERVLYDPQFTLALKNSLLVAGGTTLLTLAIASLAGYALARYEFPGSRLVILAILSARLIPGATMVIPYFVLFRTLRLTDTVPGLMLAYAGFSLPFAAWLMYGFFLEVPSDIEDSGRIDGCSDLGVFWHIVLPLTRPGLGATAILVFLGAWNEFLYALILSGREAKTLPLFLSSFIGEFKMSWGGLFAAATVMVVPALILTLLAQKNLVRGLTAGAVKG